MKLYNIADYKHGNFIGDFESAVFKTDQFSVSHSFYPKAFRGEYTSIGPFTRYYYIIFGSCIASGETLVSGDIFAYFPDEISDVVYLEDTHLVVIQVPTLEPEDSIEV